MRRRSLAAIVVCALAAPLMFALIGGQPEFGSEAARAGEASAARAEGIRVRDATLRRTPTAWRLDARADIELPPAIRSGLDSGVPLEFVLAVSLREPRRFAPDRTLFDVERRYGLVYYELTRHYRVRSLDDGTARNYRSLGTALDGLGTLAGVSLGMPGANVSGRPGVDAVAPSPLVGRLSLTLDGRALPLPLQAPFGSAWQLSSRPHEWDVSS